MAVWRGFWCWWGRRAVKRERADASIGPYKWFVAFVIIRRILLMCDKEVMEV